MDLADEAQDAVSGHLHFYIPVTSSLAERRPRTLKHADSFGLFDHNGDIVAGEGSPEGFYHEDMRHLSAFLLIVNGQRPLLLSSAVKDDNSLLTVDLTNPDLVRDGRLEQERNTIHVARARYLWDRACHERLAVRNFDDRRRDIAIAVSFAADFADLFEVRGERRAARGKIVSEIEGPSIVGFVYQGLDGKTRHTRLIFDPAPTYLDEGVARWEFSLEPGARRSLFVTIDVAAPGRPPSRGFFHELRASRRTARLMTSRAAAVSGSNDVFNEVLCRAAADLHMLITETEHGPYPYAGIPWFSCPFGRDGILTALQTLWMDPSIALGVLYCLAATQAVANDDATDAQPGKILHESRKSEMAALGEVPFRRYYGSVDGTPLFVMLAGRYFERTADIGTIHELWPNIEAALSWIDTHGDCDGDGFVEYQRHAKTGLVNQSWKDSHDSMFHADGRLAEGPMAGCEVQGYVWAAKTLAAKMAAGLGKVALAQRLESQAEILRQRFEDAYWCEEIGTYALALDRDKRPCRVRSSNAGQVLFTGIAAPERAVRVAEQLMSPCFFTGWGIRTIAEGEARYSPLSYHNGSVWPHDNALIALGFRRYGLAEHVQRLFAGMFDAASYMDLRRLPELFCGMRRLPGTGPTSYPVACAPQAWACSVPFALLEACLGIEFDPGRETVWFRRPFLPTFLDELEIKGLSLPAGRLDIILHRYGEEISVNLQRREGEGAISVSL